MTPDEKDKLLQIRLNHLEKDAAVQAKTLRQWTAKLALAEKAVKLAKRELRLKKAELSKVVRANPGKYYLPPRPPVEGIEDAVIAMSTYRDAELAFIEAEYSRDIIKGMVASLHEKGEQIGNEVKLFGNGYWVKTGMGGSEEVRKFREAIEEAEGIETMRGVAENLE